MSLLNPIAAGMHFKGGRGALYDLAQGTSRACWYNVWDVEGWFTKEGAWGSFPFIHLFLIGVLFSVQITRVEQCCMNVEEFIKLDEGETVSQ